MDIANNSSSIMKRDGESGSLWRTPRLGLKEGVEKPLLITQLDIFLENVLIHPKKDSPKPENSSDLRRKFQFKESKAYPDHPVD